MTSVHLSVCLSVCHVDGLWSHSATEIGTCHVREFLWTYLIRTLCRRDLSLSLVWLVIFLPLFHCPLVAIARLVTGQSGDWTQGQRQRDLILSCVVLVELHVQWLCCLIHLLCCNASIIEKNRITALNRTWQYMTSYVGVLATCMPQPTLIVISCDPKIYRERLEGYGKMWSFALLCMAITSASMWHFLNICWAFCCEVNYPDRSNKQKFLLPVSA